MDALAVTLRSMVESGIQRGTFFSNPNEMAMFMEFSERIELTENRISPFIRTTYYSFILNEFPMLGDVINNILQAGISIPIEIPEIPEIPIEIPEIPIDGVEPGSETAEVLARTCRFCGMCGDTQRCSCKAARYCSKKCQKDDWDEHKLECTARKIPETQRILMRRAGWVDGARQEDFPPVSPGPARQESPDGGPAARHPTPRHQTPQTRPPHITEIDTQLFHLERRIRSIAHELINSGFTQEAADEFDRQVDKYADVLFKKHKDDEAAHKSSFIEMIDSVGNIQGFRDILRRTSTGGMFRADFYSRDPPPL